MEEAVVRAKILADSENLSIKVSSNPPILTSFEALLEKGHSLLVVDHNIDLIKCADHIVDLGPEGGNKGGVLLGEGTPEELVKNKNSYTGKYLAKKILLD